MYFRNMLAVSPKTELRFLEGGPELLDAIAPLWKKLTLYTAGISTYFSQEFRTKRFSDRKRELLEKAQPGKLRVIIACRKPANRPIAYAVATVDAANIGEIDSLFVETRFRRKDIGSRLVQKTLAWLDCQKPVVKMVTVAEGNEKTFSFYRKFGFFPRVTALVYRETGRW